MIVQKNGQTFNFGLDIERAIELEEKEGFNVFDGIDTMLTAKGNPSFLGVDRVCNAILGYTLKDLMAAGFSLTDLMGEDGVILSVFKEAGFISDMKGGDSSQDNTVADQSASV